MAHRAQRRTVGCAPESSRGRVRRAGRTNGHPERDAELRVALARLPEQQRTAVFLRYYADLDYAAIGEALGINTGTVAATLNAAHTTLRTRLEEVTDMTDSTAPASIASFPPLPARPTGTTC